VDATPCLAAVAMLLDCLGHVLGGAVELLSDLAKGYNNYAYAVVGIYGHCFEYAGARVRKIFESKKMVATEEGPLASMLLWFGSVCVALATGSVAAMIAYKNPELSVGLEYPVATAMVTGAAIGHGVASVMFSVVEAANAIVFMSYVENPHALHGAHPTQYLALHHAWLAMGREDVKHDPSGHFDDALNAVERGVARPNPVAEAQDGGWHDGAEDSAARFSGSPDKRKGRHTESVDRPPTNSMARGGGGGEKSVEMASMGASRPTKLAGSGGPQGTL